MSRLIPRAGDPSLRGSGPPSSRLGARRGPAAEERSGPAEIRELAARLGVAPTKKLGQNFVHDPNTVRRIVAAAGLTGDDVVLEVGPGLGSLTLGLLGAAAHVHAVEIDPVLAAALPSTVAERADAGKLTVHPADALKVTADEAERHGLIWASVADDRLLDEGHGIAKFFASQPPRALTAIKRALQESMSNDFDTQLKAFDPDYADYKLHGIVCTTECDETAAIGDQYIALGQLTGGIISDLCLQDFQPVFDQLATEVVAGAERPATPMTRSALNGKKYSRRLTTAWSG